MSLISGIVNSIEDGVVKTGHFAGKPYKTVVLTTGNRLTCFELPFIAGIEGGKEYTFPVETKGQYINIVGAVTPVIQQEYDHPAPISPGAKGTGLPLRAKPAEEVLPKVHTPRDEREFKNRISALGSAVEFLTGVGGEAETPFSIGDVIVTAKQFLDWINGEI